MKMSPLYAVGKVLLYPIFKLLFFFKVSGKENIPDNGGYILCSNHLSNCDPVLLGLAQKRQIFYMAKAELFKNKFLGGIIRALGAFPVERGAGDGKAINMAEANDMVLVLGKGNETYEKLKDETIYFNDMEEAYNAVAERELKEKEGK